MADQLLAEILRVLQRIEARLAAAMEADGIELEGPVCPSCGSDRLEPTPDFSGHKRVTCMSCGRSTEQEAANG